MAVAPLPPSALIDEQGFAILRIKRKRGAEPLDALVIEQDETSPKRSKRRDTTARSGGVFRFAATVELASFTNKDETRQLEDRISTLSRDSPSRASPLSPAATKQQRLASYRHATHQARYRVVQDRRDDVEVDEAQSPEADVDEAKRESYSKGWGRSNGKSRFTKIWDAIEETSSPRRPGKHSTASNGPTDMDNFHVMLQEYLRVSDDAQRSAPPRDPTPSAIPPDVAVPLPPSDDADDSFVYDVYYRARSPLAGDEVNESVGALSGLTAADLMNEDSGESDSEPPLSDDEDSNEEDFYRNDYPEGEEDSSEPPDDDPFDGADDDDSD